MITLEGDELVFRFPDLHPAAECRVQLQRTLRVPDDDREYPLPPGLGRFPMRPLADYAARLDPTMVRARRSTARRGCPGSTTTPRGRHRSRGAGALAALKSVLTLEKEKGEVPLPENEPAEPAAPIELGPGPRRVREASL
jgi:hypothetical protein